MTSRDERYSHVKPLVEYGTIQTFNDIFKVVPKTIVAKDIGKRTPEFTDLMNKVQKFTLEQLFMIGTFCRLDVDTILRLALNEYKKNLPEQNNK